MITVPINRANFPSPSEKSYRAPVRHTAVDIRGARIFADRGDRGEGEEQERQGYHDGSSFPRTQPLAFGLLELFRGLRTALTQERLLARLSNPITKNTSLHLRFVPVVSLAPRSSLLVPPIPRLFVPRSRSPRGFPSRYRFSGTSSSSAGLSPPRRSPVAVFLPFFSPLSAFLLAQPLFRSSPFPFIVRGPIRPTPRHGEKDSYLKSRGLTSDGR